MMFLNKTKELKLSCDQFRRYLVSFGRVGNTFEEAEKVSVTQA